MDAIGNISFKPVVSGSSAGAAPALPLPKSDSAPVLPTLSADTGVDFNQVDQRREAAAQRAAQQIAANALPLGSTVFTLFRDASGQMITRFRDTITNKVTYYPEPQLLQQGGSSTMPSLELQV